MEKLRAEMGAKIPFSLVQLECEIASINLRQIKLITGMILLLVIYSDHNPGVDSVGKIIVLLPLPRVRTQ